MDIDTLKTLWVINISTFGDSFQMVNDMLVTTSRDRIILVDKQGNKKEINVDSEWIISVAGVSSGYIYVVGSEWTLEAYDYLQDVMLWKKGVGRGGCNAFYDSARKLVYVTNNDSIYADDNLTGKLLWEIAGSSGELFENGILYTLTDTDKSDVHNLYAMNAIDIATQKKLWSKDYIFPPDHTVKSIVTMGNLLIVSGDGIVALDRSTGAQKWILDVYKTGEDFYTKPVEYNNVIYAMGYASNAVFAISALDGSIIGTANLEEDNPFAFVQYAEIFSLKDGILFNTSNSIVIYKQNK